MHIKPVDAICRHDKSLTQTCLRNGSRDGSTKQVALFNNGYACSTLTDVCGSLQVGYSSLPQSRYVIILRLICEPT